MLSQLRMRRRADAGLAVLDAGTALLASLIAFRLRFEGETIPDRYLVRYRVLTAVAVLLVVLVGRVAGLYRRAALRPGASNLPEAFEVGITVGLLLAVVNLVALGGAVSRAWIVMASFLVIVGGVLTRGLVRRGRRVLVPFGIGLERYALVGQDASARRLHGDLTRAGGAPYEVVDLLDPALGARGLLARARELRLDGLVLPESTLGVDDAAALAAALSGEGVDVLIAPGVKGLELRVTSIAMLHGVPLLRAAALAPRRKGVRVQPRDRARRGVAILGTRGIPANYGGFETFAERLALGLVEQGVPVTVYCRSHYATAGEEWRGVRLVTLPTVRSKYFDTVVHTLLSALHLLLRSRTRDVILCNAANAPVVPLLRLGGRRVVLNVDGLEWRRAKWGIAGRSWYRMGEWLSVRSASVLVTDAEEVRTYYHVRHDTDSLMISYGADALERGSVPPPLDLEADRYVLYVSRWEPENNPVLVARAHALAGTDVPLVMLGEATYDDRIAGEVRAVAAPTAVLPGSLYGEGYQALQANALCYVHATEVGGTHPALIEALAAGNVCLVMDTPENREVVGGVGRFFTTAEELAELIRWAAALPPEELGRLRAEASALAAERYSWDAVTRQYLEALGRVPG